MPDTIRIGIVGTGFAERVQMPGLAHVEGARLVAVSSGHRSSAERAARAFGIPNVCDDAAELASRDDVDLVIISSPPFTHASATLAALAAGKHVLCEKPMALNVGEADAMVAAADAVGVLSLIDHELRFNPTRRRARQLIAEGYVGTVRHVSAVYRANIGRRHQAFTWWYQTSTGGGLLGAVGSHVIDTCRWWLGEIADVDCTLRTFVAERPDAASGTMRRVESDDFASLRMRSASGVTIEASLSSVAPGPTEHRFEVVGSDGTLLLDDERLTLTGWRDDRTEDLTEPDPARGLPGLINALWAPSFVNLAREIVTALRDGRTTVPGAATFRDGRAVQVVLDEARASAARRAS
ncbi:MAG TPA: Gfo/Idh/MocA family oxidoreductase [Blastocatellia bacterium]|nr:Gfo/Idh/MocA family oxidoreductase [Blastocatellia bacterium]